MLDALDAGGNYDQPLKRGREDEDSAFDSPPLRARPPDCEPEFPPSKRERWTDPSPTPVPATSRDKYNFDDGNVIVHTADCATFQVHRGVLSFHSSYLRDVLSVSSDDSWEDVGGRIMLRVGESELEVGWLLEIMYEGANRWVLIFRYGMFGIRLNIIRPRVILPVMF